MNDGYRGPQGHDPYQDPYARGYDPYGQQGYDYDRQDAPQDPGAQGYPEPSSGYGYDYDPYAQQPPPPRQSAAYPPQAPRAQQHYAPQAPPPAVGYDYDYDPYGPAAHSGEQPVTPVPPDGEWGRIPQQRPPGEEPPGQGRPPHEPREYATEQFSFVEDETESSEDVIDWLKFTESRTERREEAKRRGRNRRVALLLVMVLAVLGGTGYLWATDRLPFVGGDAAPAEAGEEKRDTLVVHLHDTDGGGSATALLVNNATTGKGTTVLLPNDLAVSGDDGTATTLGQAVDEQGAGATRDAIDALLGSQIKGSWRLDTPYLEILVEGVGGITLDADATVPGAKKGEDPLVEKGQKRRLNGEEAIAYATHQADGEPQTAQLQRFGQVMEAVLKKLPSDTAGAKSLVKSMGMVLDPSLSEAELAASLASLSELAKEGAYATETLEVGGDGRPSEQATQKVVEDVLGGTVKNPGGATAARVSVQNGVGSAKSAETAKVALVNGGFTFVDGGQAAEPAAASEVRYGDAAAKEQAVQVAKTLGLPEKAVAKGKTPANADVVVVLGQDYEG
ncbi:LytR C-terminal domain-containing protein [Streptomyces sp. NBC_01808]|uniref:LCP family protein n=1 Tax=Streptomyces sp. NBC_01808 TaxID=2975947 RepID=UPI002DD92060|nr:LytR C-terminal domain-containing protein [Streptomyces sp. NBC_01808]WSA37794.1 LytR C-terminal domain-containing protein [Streptomyces sp. NBC_01808]